MQRFLSKKVMAVTTALSIVTAVGAVAYADSALKQITAYQNAGIQLKVNGSPVDLSSEDGMMYPIVYEGHSYVSAKAVAEALGATVKWNNDTQTVEISSSGSVPSGAGIPSKDNSSSSSTKPASQKPSSSASSGNAGTISDPIRLGTSYTYTDYDNYKAGEYDTSSATYTVTVNGTTPISREEIESLGFKKPEDNSLVDYVLVNVTVGVSNAALKKGSDSSQSGYKYLSSYVPSFWGVKTPDGNSLIGGNDGGFDGSLDRSIDNALSDFPKVVPGDSKSYQATGNILMPIYKGQENLLTIKKNDVSLAYDNAFVYFDLE